MNEKLYNPNNYPKIETQVTITLTLDELISMTILDIAQLINKLKTEAADKERMARHEFYAEISEFKKNCEDGKYNREDLPPMPLADGINNYAYSLDGWILVNGEYVRDAAYSNQYSEALFNKIISPKDSGDNNEK